MKIDRLFEEATQPEPPAQALLAPVKGAPERLRLLLEAQLPALLTSSIAVERRRYARYRVDGNIIGTGALDFTQDNTCYTLKYSDDKTFQLFDVPGIEGNEGKYAAMVKAAVAKAHLVFYVNGTNKKPEKATAEKIRDYLHRGTQVSPIYNVRGNADAYEFDEDRESLAANGGEKGLAQTMQVLRGVLGDEVLLEGHCVQGLLAFSSLALRDGASTIHPSREQDLVVQQRNCLKYFASPKAMYEFSQLQQVAGVLHAKLGTFKEDIVESNKAKVRELLADNLDILDKMRGEHQAFLAGVEPEFEKCRAAVEAARATFVRVLGAGRKNLWNTFFNELSERADTIVAAHFGDSDEIASRIDKAFRAGQKETEAKLQAHLEEQMKTLEHSLAQAMQRLVEDVRRVDFQQRLRTAKHESTLRYESRGLEMDLGMKEWGAIAFNIGSYAATGATIGSAFPVVGTLIGAAVGAVLGAIVSVFGFFAGKEKRIRKAQSQVQEKIDEVREQVLGGLAEDLKKLSAPLHEEVDRAVLGWVDAMYAALAAPLDVIGRQAVLMNKTKNQLEKMPYGTIQPIQY